MANVVGKGCAVRTTDESRKKIGPKGQRFLDRTQQFKNEIVGKWSRRTGKTKSFGSLCPPGCVWPFKEKR